MNHGHMDHGRHMCSMNMLFTWSTQDLCIIFRGWHIRNTWTLLLSLAAIVAITAGYELVREVSRRYEEATKERLENIPRSSKEAIEKSSKVVKALLYAVQVFYSFFIMLLFMTYNGWVMLAVAVGAFVGYLAFGHGSATKTVACH